MCDFTEMNAYIVELRAMREHVDSTLARYDATLSPAASTDPLPCGGPLPASVAAGDPLSHGAIA